MGKIPIAINIAGMHPEKNKSNILMDMIDDNVGLSIQGLLHMQFFSTFRDGREAVQVYELSEIVKEVQDLVKALDLKGRTARFFGFTKTFADIFFPKSGLDPKNISYVMARGYMKRAKDEKLWMQRYVSHDNICFQSYDICYFSHF